MSEDRQWIEISLKTTGELAEAIVDVLQRYGHQGLGMQIQGLRVERCGVGVGYQCFGLFTPIAKFPGTRFVQAMAGGQLRYFKFLPAE